MVMGKDFDAWNSKKKDIEKKRPGFYAVRKLWWCELGLNVGTEQDGGENFLRPVLVLRGFGISTCLVAPITTSERTHPLRVPIKMPNGTTAKVNVSQLRVVDTRRFIKNIGMLDIPTFRKIRKAARDLF
jgi:mRNA-degrading endonuclease toxin of MazEF toxin-antitoxin module